MNDEQLLRYSRHILLPQIGIEGQARLLAARALVIGAGGLGSPIALYLAAAGVGTGNFIILLLIGWAYAHKAQTRAIIARVLHRGPRR